MNEHQGVPLLELPVLLAEHGYRSVQLCHFLLPSRDQQYLEQIRESFEAAQVAIECFLIDDGDVTHPTRAAAEEAWISDWVSVGEALGAPRTRVIAGKRPPTAQTLAASGQALARLASEHPQTRIVTENWHDLLPNADSVLTLLDATGSSVGFLIDLGNWTQPESLDELAAVAGQAETCQAKCRTHPDGSLDLEGFAKALQVLRNVAYEGPLALVYDGPDADELARLEDEFAVVEEVFATPGR